MHSKMTARDCKNKKKVKQKGETYSVHSNKTIYTTVQNNNFKRQQEEESFTPLGGVDYMDRITPLSLIHVHKI